MSMKYKIIQSLIVVAIIWILICTFAHKIFQLYANEQKEYSTLKWFCRLHLQLL